MGLMSLTYRFKESTMKSGDTVYIEWPRCGCTVQATVCWPAGKQVRVAIDGESATVPRAWLTLCEAAEPQDAFPRCHVCRVLIGGTDCVETRHGPVCHVCAADVLDGLDGLDEFKPGD
jgi:hypothetical protein